MRGSGLAAGTAIGLVVLLAACGEDDGSSVSAGAVVCSVAADPSGPLLTDFGGLLVPPVPPPDGWLEPPQEGFDWDQDGSADVLGFDQADGSVSVSWAGGSLTVTGVRSDFAGEPGQPVEPGGDPFLEQPTESGPPSERAEATGTAAPAPAAVADVTGDGRLDLIVADGGWATVVVGAGAASTTVEVAQADVGGTVEGWRSPPIVPRPPTGTVVDQPPVPYDQATVVPRWDLTGDGVDDWVVESNLPRALGPQAAYAGRPCA